MKSAIVIPVRYGSSRFPGKPLAQIKGRTMLERIWRLCRSVSEVDQVIVATDDERIEDHARGFGAECVRTPGSCRNGSERVFEAVLKLPTKPELVINVQGDAVLTPPWMIQALVNYMQQNQTCRLGTLAYAFTDQEFESARKAPAGSSGVFVTMNNGGQALYFSRAIIPHWRDGAGRRPELYRHVGIYAFQFETLRRYISFEPGALEETEKLEQLRALENGIPIHVVTADRRGRTLCSVDCPEHAVRAADIIEREGELLPD